MSTVTRHINQLVLDILGYDQDELEGVGWFPKVLPSSDKHGKPNSLGTGRLARSMPMEACSADWFTTLQGMAI